MAEKLTSETFDAFVGQSALPVLIDFYRDGCLPCRRIAPLLSRAETQYGDKVAFARVNIDMNTDLAERYAVTAAPTLLLLQDGEEKDRRTGAADPEDIKLLIESV